jgi:hypothetical protein
MQDQSAHPKNTWLEQREPHVSSALPTALRRLDDRPNIETTLIALGIALDEARASVPEKLFTLLSKDPGKSAFQTVLAQLGDARLVRLLAWLSAPGHATRHALLAGLLTPGAGDAGQAIASILQSLNQRTLILRMIGDERIETLHAVCQPLRAQEAGAPT